jgi:hypothetical protein
MNQQPDLNLLEFDAVSLAARTANVAAAELYGLMTTGEPNPNPLWFVGDQSELSEDEISDYIERIAKYICFREVEKAQTVLYWASSQKLPGFMATGSIPKPVQMTLQLFTDICLKIYKDIKAIQLALARDQEVEAPRNTAPKHLAESIFDDEDETIDAQLPDSKAAQELMAKTHVNKEPTNAQISEASTGGSEDAPGANQLPDAGSPAIFTLVQESEITAALITNEDMFNQPAGPAEEVPQTLSVGETVATKPKNKGGRGRKKSKKTK